MLKVRLMRNGVGGTLLRWIISYIHNRRGRVNFNQAFGRKFLLRHGVPKGDILSPTLVLPKGVNAALFANDLFFIV